MTPAEILAEANRQCEAATKAADYLAQAISIHFGAHIGEHTEAHDPWTAALDVIEAADPPAAAAAGADRLRKAPFDLARHLRRQMRFSACTFGPGARVNAIIDHITKELAEVRASGGDLAEWIDIIILGLDGAWRSGADPREIIHALVAKQWRNERRCWPDWRTAAPDKAIEHVRTEEAKRERVYISGPMSGIEDHNFPAFHAAAAKLRAAGFEVVNPAEINTDPGMSWAQCLRNDMAELAHCDTLALLPQWQISNGAHLELHVAHRLQMRIVMVEELTGGEPSVQGGSNG